MPDIVCLGEPLFELNQTRQGEPAYLAGHGGDTSNCAVAAARQDASVGYLTALGQDTFGDSFLDLWQRERVDTSTIRRRADCHTGIYFITHGAAGHVFSYLRKGSAASRITPEDLPEDYIKGARVLHASGISQAISESACDTVFAAMVLAKAAGVLVAYDTNLRLKLWPLARAQAVIHAAAGMADILLPGIDDARALTGLSEPDAIVDHYLALGVRVVGLTLGHEGALVATPERRERLSACAVEAVDATGAGDTFDGAFLAEYLLTRDAFASGRYANAAAALSTRGFGAVAPMPYRAEVEAFLATPAGGGPLGQSG